MDKFVYNSQDLEASAYMPDYYSWFFQLCQPYLHGPGIEFDGGIGTVSALLKSQPEKLVLVEPAAKFTEGLNERFSNDKKIKTSKNLLENFIVEYEDNSFDTVVLINVSEHIKDDALALQNLDRVLKPGGDLIIFVPALKFLFSKMNADLGHFRRYQSDELNTLVNAAGMKLISAKYFYAQGVLPWWIVNTIMGKTDFDPRLTRLYDTLGIPLKNLWKIFSSLQKMLHK
jgi:SAM-dependent methyltransferase